MRSAFTSPAPGPRAPPIITRDSTSLTGRPQDPSSFQDPSFHLVICLWECIRNVAPEVREVLVHDLREEVVRHRWSQRRGRCGCQAERPGCRGSTSPPQHLKASPSRPPYVARRPLACCGTAAASSPARESLWSASSSGGCCPASSRSSCSSSSASSSKSNSHSPLPSAAPSPVACLADSSARLPPPWDGIRAAPSHCSCPPGAASPLPVSNALAPSSPAVLDDDPVACAAAAAWVALAPQLVEALCRVYCIRLTISRLCMSFRGCTACKSCSSAPASTTSDSVT